MSFAALITNFSSNTAAAAVGTPIAVSIAEQLGVAPEPLVLAVLFGCNLCYATPVAYQTNILIMSAGGYQFKDYVRAGLPLVIIMVVTLSIGEFNLTWMLHTPLTKTLPVGLADSYASMRLEIASAYTLVFFVMIVPLLVAMQVAGRRSKRTTS